MIRQILCAVAFCFGVTTLQAADDAMRFAVFSDVHVSPGIDNETFLKRSVDEVNADSSIEFVIASGDLSNSGANAELDAVKAQLDRLQVPCYVIPGNHETNWSQSAGLRILENWGDDRFVFRKGNFIFIGFSTGPYMKMGDSNVKSQDIKWLDRTLAAMVKAGDRVICVGHCPFIGEQGGMNNWSDVVDVLKKYDTAATLHGHFHSYQLRNIDGIPGILFRSLVMDGTGPGYSIVDLNDRELKVFNKVLGEALPAEPVFDIDFATLSALKDLKPETRPDPDSFREQPADAEVELVLDDGSSMFSGLSVDGDVLYYANSLGEVKAYDWKNGRLRWSRDLGSAVYSTPLYGDGVVVVGSPHNAILGLNAENGETLWSIETAAPVVNDGLIVGDKLYMGAGMGDFLKIDLKSGKIDWRFSGVNGIFQARPAVAGGKVVFGAWDRHLYCLDEATGKELWRWNNGKAGVLLSPGNCIPALTGNKVIIVAPDRYMTAFTADGGRQLWRDNQYKYRESMGISPDGSTVYAKTMDGELIAVSTETPEYELRWRCDTGMGYEHTPSPVIETKGRIFLASRTGVLYCVDAVTGRLLWQYNCGNSQVNNYFLDEDGNLYLTLVEGKIYKVTLP